MEELFQDIQNEAYDYEDYEVILPMLLYKNFNCVEHLGVTQDIALFGKIRVKFKIIKYFYKIDDFNI